MSYCFNPACGHPLNPDSHQFCQSCGGRLWLGDRYGAVQPLGPHTWLGRDRRTLVKPQCLIKGFIPAGDTAGARLAAADRLRQAIARLDTASQHPQLPALFGYFESPLGAPGQSPPARSGPGGQYLVQQYVVGERLDQRLQAWGTLDGDGIRTLLKQVLPILHHLHRHTLIHRDVKPRNLVRPGDDSRWWLVDLGSAKPLTATSLAQGGTVVGSAEYAAPEQLQGQATFASDLYGLGVSCLHGLTGLRPFDLFDGVNGCWHWRSIVPDIDATLAQVLDALVQPRLRDRIPSAAAALEALGLPRPPEPISPTPSSAHSSQSAQWLPQAQQSLGQPLLGAVLGAGSPPGKLILLTQAGTVHVQLPLPLAPLGAPIKAIPDQATAIAAHGTTSLLALGTRTGHLWVAHGPNLEQWQGPFPAHTSAITQICVTPGEEIITGGEDGCVGRWRAQQGTWQRVGHLAHGVPIQALALGEDGETLAVGDSKGAIAIATLPQGQWWRTLTGHRGGISALAWLPGGEILVSAGWDVSLQWRRAATGGVLQHRAAQGFLLPLRSLLPLSTGELVSGSQEGHLHRWPGVTLGQPEISPPGPALDTAQPEPSPILALLPLSTSAPDSPQWLSVSQSGTLIHWGCEVGV